MLGYDGLMRRPWASIGPVAVVVAALLGSNALARSTPKPGVGQVRSSSYLRDRRSWSSKRLVIMINPETGAVVSVTGPPVTAVINPESGALISIRRANPRS